MLAETPLICPPDQAKGCLGREIPYGKVQGIPKFEDRIDLIPEDVWQDYLKRTALRPHIKVILSQGRVGSCATEMLAGGTMGIRSIQNQDHILLNPWSMYAFTSGGRDQGSNLDTNMQFSRERGMLPEEIWPRSKGWDRRAPDQLWEDVGCYFKVDEIFDIASTVETGTALFKDFFVGFGWKGHSCLLVQMVDRYTALYANSWDKTWGDKGFGLIRLSSINFGYGAFAFRTTVDSTAFNIVEYKRAHASLLAQRGVLAV